MTVLTQSKPVVSYSAQAIKVLSQTYMGVAMFILNSAIVTTLFNTVFIDFTKEHPIALFVISLVLMIGSIFATIAKKDTAAGFAWGHVLAGSMGAMISPMMVMVISKYTNGMDLIGMSFFGAGGLMAGLSAYVYYSGKNFSFLRGALTMALWGLIFAGILNIFFGSSIVMASLAALGVMVFSGYVLMDTSDILNGTETNWIMASVNMYLNFMNLFLDILRLALYFFGESSD